MAQAAKATDADAAAAAASEAEAKRRAQLSFQKKQATFMLVAALIGIANVWRRTGIVPAFLYELFQSIGFSGFPRPADVLPASLLP